MPKNLLLYVKRKWLLLRFRTFNINYHTQHLGEAMARKEVGHNRDYHHEKIHEAIQEICDKRNLRPDDLSLIEEELNDYINSRVQAAFDRESQKLKAREFVDTRIKIKHLEDGDSQSPPEKS